MDDVVTAQLENENLKKIRSRLMRWEAKNNPLAALSLTQEEQFEVLNTLCTNEKVACDNRESCALKEQRDDDKMTSLEKLQQMPSAGIDTTHDFLLWFDQVHSEIYEERDTAAQSYLQQLTNCSHECSRILQQIEQATKGLQTLKEEYTYVSLKTEHLNKSSEQLIEEQQSLQKLANEIQQHLYYFNQVELLNQRLYSPTLSVTSEAFRECLCKIDECLNYVKDHSQYKEAAAFIVKYKHCLNKAISLIRNYIYSIMTQCTEATLHPKQMGMSGSDSTAVHTAPDAAFALYYGKYQIAAVKIKHIIRMVESRVGTSAEYGDLLSDLQHNYVQQRSVIMTPAVDKAITDIKVQHKGDHCALMRSACAFLVHICQDEHRLYYQFFVNTSDQLTTYLESLCNTLYDTMRPYIIHINHLETLAEICSILRIEMLEEHVQQNPTALEAFGTVVHQLLQDVQERLVFRAYLYLQSDILHYNPSAGDLAYPEKLEMMERIALSLQEANQMRRFDSRSSLVSCASNNTDLESVDTSVSRLRSMNSPADLHGMWYPTVRRTLVCLSRLYRCVDRPIFQGLSQEALKLCIQSVAAAAAKISAAKTAIDGELFEIKHMLILREQIAPFRVDFTVKETSLDFSKVKSAAFGLLQKRKQLFTIGSNNALLEFLLEGTPQIKEHMLDSRKAVDRQLKMVCEQFIQDGVKELIAPLLNFLQRAYQVVGKNDSMNKPAPVTVNQQQSPQMKINYNLRQSAWASPQQISSVIQETQRLIKKRLPILQRSMQLYLSNRDTEFIIFRPIRNNVIKNFANLEQLLINNSYSSDDMVITSYPSTEQVSILLSSASILTAEGMINFSKATLQQPQRSLSENNNEAGDSCSQTVPPHKISYEKKVSFDNPSSTTTPTTTMENVDELQTTSLNYSAEVSAESTFETNK